MSPDRQAHAALLRQTKVAEAEVASACKTLNPGEQVRALIRARDAYEKVIALVGELPERVAELARPQLPLMREIVEDLDGRIAAFAGKTAAKS